MSEQTMVVTQPVETDVVVVNPVTPTVPEVSLNPLDFQKEINKIAAEKGMEIKDGNAVLVPQATQQAVPATPQAASQPSQAEAQPPAIPEKFQTKDGQVDLTKVEKSTVNAEEAIRKYREKETELRKLQNGVHKLEQTVQPVPAQPPIAPQNYQITPEQINKALEETKNPGKVLLELQQITYQAAYQQAKSDIEARLDEINQRVEQQRRDVELQKIADNDPWVFSEEGIQKLTEIRQRNPWLNNAPHPWEAAYMFNLASRQIQKPASQVMTPNPVAQTVRAPATPVSAEIRTQTPPVNIAQLSPSALNKYLDSLTPEQQTAFFRAAIPGAK